MSLARAIERVRAEVDTPPRSGSATPCAAVFGRVLKELADLDNPMRTLLGDVAGDDGCHARTPADPA